MMPVSSTLERPVRDDDVLLLDAIVLELSPLRLGAEATYDERLLHTLLHRTQGESPAIPVALGQALRRLVLRYASVLPHEIIALAKHSMHGPPPALPTMRPAATMRLSLRSA